MATSYGRDPAPVRWGLRLITIAYVVLLVAWPTALVFKNALADGLGAAAIGEKLYLSESTAKSHIARIYQKLGASNRAQALVTAMRIGLLSSVNPDAAAR